ncbi:MAG: DarT ssDNA thymidine ADP-ribosyltransferase family protein [bacterium]|nr:DarT ssDNA thymidine ADP-ribosyltransferase family protein [bacterium]
MASKIRHLYYITHIDNLSSILKYGILSHKQIEERKISYTPIYDKEIIENRHNKLVPGSSGRNLWDFANLYFQPRNPMLYRVIYEKSVNDIIVIALKSDILNRDDIFISLGNAASFATEILPEKEGKQALYKLTKILDKEWWTEESGDKRKIMAECLVPEMILPEYIHTIYVAHHDIANKVKELLPSTDISVVPQPNIFFKPSREIEITPLLYITDGDMFFSRMQTLTISVNCVGIMGKGLASRAKWQFPDVYVQYQYAYRNRTLLMGKPYLYKREGSLDYQFADEPATLKNGNTVTWFLLFPTKQHWKENADIKGIEKGLNWIVDNYKKEGIKSLALPALGCGLGNLKWQDVGPLMCKYLSKLDIPIRIYLPTEKKVYEEYFTKKFLIG